jgi:hypothetical protein
MSDDGISTSGTDNGGQQDNTTSTTTATTGGSATDSTNGDNGFDASDWKSFAAESGLSVDQVKAKLGHARTWEDRAKANKTAADELNTLRGQFDKMQQRLAERDQRDTDRAAKLAMAEVRSQLTELGVHYGEVKELLDEYESKRLLKDGEPNDEAIGRLAKALAKAAGRPAPDVDQGQKGDDAPPDMNRLIRRAAGRG